MHRNQQEITQLRYNKDRTDQIRSPHLQLRKNNKPLQHNGQTTRQHPDNTDQRHRRKHNKATSQHRLQHTGYKVQFTDKSTGSTQSRTWDFGDGSKSTEKNPTHTYQPGTYTIKLTI
ncbi:MAG TPA: PKD domain-containing protein, partial [Thermoanaerobacterium sp.]|nr:PKD domain-containing protein [Thermoanaerobacterium sp.]